MNRHAIASRRFILADFFERGSDDAQWPYFVAKLLLLLVDPTTVFPNIRNLTEVGFIPGIGTALRKVFSCMLGEQAGHHHPFQSLFSYGVTYRLAAPGQNTYIM